MEDQKPNLEAPREISDNDDEGGGGGGAEKRGSLHIKKDLQLYIIKNKRVCFWRFMIR